MRPDLQNRLQLVAKVITKLAEGTRIAPGPAAEQRENTSAMTNSGNAILQIVARLGAMLQQMSELFNQMNSFQFPEEDLEKVKAAKQRLIELHDILSTATMSARKKAREIVPVLSDLKDFARSTG